MKEMTMAAQTARAIRNELKAKFPGVKFSVRSENFSMGNSVSVSWTDGPRQGDVDAIVGKYQYGHFNGMEDIYENSNSRNDIPQAKYVHARREHSEAREAKARETFIREWGIDPDDQEAVKAKFHDYCGAEREIRKILDEAAA